MAEIKGLDDVLRKLRTLPDALDKGGTLDKAMRKGAQIWRDEAKALAPAGSYAKPERLRSLGTLRENIGYRRDPDPESNKFTHRYVVGYGKAFWGKFVELGSAAFYKSPREYPMTPFLRPTFDNTQREVLDTIAGVVRKDIEKEARK